MSITYSECVFVALVIQHAMRVRQLPYVAWSCLEMKTEISHTEHSETGHQRICSICEQASLHHTVELRYSVKKWAEYFVSL
jgi:hypothetical protein